MNRGQVLSTLRKNQPALREAGILHLSLFGSTARGDETADSDIDLIATFDNIRRTSIFDIAGMELDLAKLLGRKVDLIEEGTLKPLIQSRIETETHRAF